MKRRTVFRRRLFRPAWKRRLELNQLYRRGAPFDLSEEGRAWLNMLPVGLEWPNGEGSVPHTPLINFTLPPPPGYASWLDYSVEHLDVRELQHTSLLDESIWGGEISRDAFLEAARHELHRLRMQASSQKAIRPALMSEQELSDIDDDMLKLVRKHAQKIPQPLLYCQADSGEILHYYYGGMGEWYIHPVLPERAESILRLLKAGRLQLDKEISTLDHPRGGLRLLRVLDEV